MRIAVFTANPDLESTPFWQVVLRTPGLSAVLVVRRISSHRPRDVLRRFRRNVRKHGVLFAPYRVALFVFSQLARFAKGSAKPEAKPASPVPVEEIAALDIHSNEVLDRVRAWSPDLGVSLGAPILRRPLFGIPRLGTLNVHLGKVPDFRGAPPGFWELWFDAAEIGATVHWMDDGLDTGAIVAEATAPIYRRDNVARVEARASELAQSLLGAALGEIAAGRRDGTTQSPGGTTHRFPTLRQEFRLWRRLAWRRVSARCRDPLSMAKLAITALWLAAYRPVRDLLRTMLGRHPVRIFTFHRVTNLCRDGMTVPPDVFRRQLEHVRAHHELVALDRALELLAAGTVLRRPVAAITFDDGYRSVRRAAGPHLAELGVSGTCFVCTSLTGSGERLPHDENNPARERMDVMDWDELGHLARSGWAIGGHTATHSRLSTLDDATLRREVGEPAAALRERLGVTHPAMAFPFGARTDCTDEGVRAVKAAGYSALFSNFGGDNYPGDDPYTLKRIDLGGDHDTLMWKASALGLDLAPWKRRLKRDESPRRTPERAAAAPAIVAPRENLRVTQVVFDLDGGGMESLVAAMAEHWWGSDVRVSVITLSGRIGRVGEKVRPMVEQFHVLRLTPGISMVSPHGLMRALRQTRPDVVHVHTGAWLKGAYAARLARVPRVIYTEHGREHHDPALVRFQDRLASRMTHRVVAVSDRLGTYMTQAVRVQADRVVTIPNGVDTALFRPRERDGSLRAELGIRRDALVVGSVGRLEPVKAYTRLVAAFAELRKTDFGVPLALVIFGEGSDRPAIEREIDRLGVRDNVHLPGWTDHPAMGFRTFDIFAMTSVSEGMSVSLMEAMACGICPVVTDVGSNAEVLGPGLADHVVPDDDAGRLVRVIRDLLASPEKRAAAAARARATAVERHSLGRMIADYEALYREGR